MRRPKLTKRALWLLAIPAAMLMAVPLIAQESDAEQKSGLLRFVEDKLSTPERQIALNGLDGVLSSDVSVDEITISDEEGVWLRIDNAKLNWDQGALLFGQLKIKSLIADSIDYIRPSIPPEGMQAPAPEAGGLEIPELPVAVFLEELSVPSVTFGESVFGSRSEVSLEGRLVLEGGSLDTNLDIERLDGPGGTLKAAVKYANASKELDLDLALTEPQDGMVANLLNIEGKPEISLTLQGSGPLEGLEANLALDADGKRVLSGVAKLTKTGDGLDIDADLRGPVATLMPADYRGFFGSETHLTAQATLRDAGGLLISDVSVSGGDLSLTGNADTAADGFLRTLKVDAEIANASGGEVVLPVPGKATKLRNARFTLDYGTGQNWSGALDIDGFTNAGLSAKNIRLDLNGAAMNLATPAQRRITLNADGAVTGIRSDDPEIEDALGDTIGLGIAGLWNAGEPIKLVEARVAGQALNFTMAGDIDNYVFDGGLAVKTPSLAPFSGIAGRQLSGGVNVTANGTIAPLTGGFDLDLNGKASNLGTGIEAVDNLLAGDTNLSGRLARTEQGFAATDFAIGNVQSKIIADGNFSSTSADFDFGVSLSDLGLLSDNASGALTLNGSAKGADGPISLNFKASVPSGKLVDKNLTNAALTFDGTLTDGNLGGKISGDGFLDGYRVTLASQVAMADGVNSLSGLRFETLGTMLNGDVLQNKDGLLRGDLVLKSTDLSHAAALFLMEATGAIEAQISLVPDGETQVATVSAKARNVHANDIAIGSADIDARIADLFGVPEVNGKLNGSNIAAAGVDIETLAASATHSGNETAFTGSAALATGTDIQADGSLTPLGEGYTLALNTLSLDQGALKARLAAPTSLTINGDSVALKDVRLNVGNGSISVSGSAGQDLKLDAAINALPLSIANAIVPDLGVDGTIGGTVQVRGKNSDPQVTFDMEGRGISAAMIASYGVTPLSLSASGTYAKKIVRLAAAQVNGPQGLNANISGSMPIVGSNGNLNVKGSAPLSLANALLGNRGTQVSGTANINASVTGSLSKPAFNGGVTIANGEVVDPQSNLRLQQISTRLSLQGERVVIDQFSGALATGGSVSAAGSIGLDDDLPSDLNVTLNSARYADGNLFVATASGQLAITGALLRDPLLAGNLMLEKAEISVPDIPANSGALVDVTHVDLPADVAQTLRRVHIDDPAEGGTQSDLRLDVTVNAPNQVFVRGRGIDAELGGSVKLQGSLSNIQPVGGFELIRGRLSILGQRIVFDSGRVTLVGDLNPYVDLSASSASGDTTVFVKITGPVSDLDVNFTSTPQLPQDEVLSLLIFKRALGDLSPLQLAKLAAAASELAGGSNQSLVDSLREATGLDDLDVITDDKGNTAVRAGRYIQDNVYVSVEAGAQGKSKVSIDLDLGEGVKARGSTANDGETSLGVFYEQDF